MRTVDPFRTKRTRHFTSEIPINTQKMSFLWDALLSAASPPLTLSAVGVALVAVLTFGKLYFNGGMVPSYLLNHTNLNGKVAIVTGPSLGGIGFEAAAFLYSR